MPRKKVDLEQRDAAIASRMRDAEGLLATLVFRMENLVRHAEATDAPGHAGLYDDVAVLLAHARAQTTAACELMETGDPDLYLLGH